MNHTATSAVDPAPRDRGSCWAPLEAAVADCESVSDAEVVVVVADRSGPYRDVRFLVGTVLSVAALVTTVHGPFDFTAELLAPALLVVFALGFTLPTYVPALFRIATGRARRTRHVEAAAELAFVRQAVMQTRRRTGILMYVSLLEADGHLLGDVAVRRAVPGDVMGRLQVALDRAIETVDPVAALPTFVAGDLRDALARFVPALDDNPDELPNAPVSVDDGGPIG